MNFMNNTRRKYRTPVILLNNFKLIQVRKFKYSCNK